MMPSETSGRPSFAFVDAVRSVHASASSHPPPSAKPLTIATDGFVIFSRRAKTCWPEKARSFAAKGCILASSLMSAPATKAFSPAPVTTRQRRAASASTSSNAAASSRSVCAFRAFITFGRFTVTNATAPARSRRMFSKPTAPVLVPADADDRALHDRLRLEGPVLRIALGVDDLLGDVEAADELAEGRILAVQRWRRLVHDEELARCRVGAARAGHREDAGLVLLRVELRLEHPRSAARSGASRVTALDHEARDHAVEDLPVVEPRVAQIEEVADVVRRNVRPELHLHATW